MKILLIFVFLVFGIDFNSANDVKCNNGGCYEVVKVFAELLEKKINETDAVSEKILIQLTQICV
jgi:hypothetical protein